MRADLKANRANALDLSAIIRQRLARKPENIRLTPSSEERRDSGGGWGGEGRGKEEKGKRVDTKYNAEGREEKGGYKRGMENDLTLWQIL